MLLLYILWDGWPIFMISDSKEKLQKEVEYTLIKPDCHSWWISKMQSGREDTLEERYAIKYQSCPLIDPTQVILQIGGGIPSHWYFHNFFAICIWIYTAFRIKMLKAIVIHLHFHIVSVYIHLNNTIHIHNIYGSPVSAGPYFLLLK